MKKLNLTQVLVIIAVVLATFMAVDGFKASPEELEGEVVARAFKASESSHGTIIGHTMDGNMGVGMVSTYSSEEYVVIVRVKSTGEVYSVKVGPEVYASVSDGDDVEVIEYKGFITGWTFKRKIEQR